MAIDLRTDFTTRPTEAMVAAMMAAARDRPGFGPRDDPHVVALEKAAARMLGKDDALFCATCASANQIAIAVTCMPGDALVTETTSHILTSEGGAVAAVAGATARTLHGRRGIVDIGALAEVMDEGDGVQPRTRLVVVENTHVRSGGCVLPLEYMAEVRRLASERRVHLHLDGSRLFNAAAALGVPAGDVADLADSVSVSMNKGLAAPLGAVLAGSEEFIARAMRVRHRLGGTWRPAGIPAAAALVGLETMVERLGVDHENASRLAAALQDVDGLSVDLGQVQTNIVLIDLAPHLGSAADAAAALKELGILVLPFGKGRLRLVTSYEIGAAELEETVSVFRRWAAPPARSPRSWNQSYA